MIDVRAMIFDVSGRAENGYFIEIVDSLHTHSSDSTSNVKLVVVALEAVLEFDDQLLDRV